MANLIHMLAQMVYFFWTTLPIWLPVATGFLAWEIHLQYVRKKFQLSNPKILLEIKLPQIITKSPLAMELIIMGLHMTNREGTFIDRYFKGQRRPYFSLELASMGGDVKFFIWTEAGFKNFIEAQIYAQYPGIEITEVPDYTQGIAFDPTQNQMWACDYIKTAPDVLPIKTYIDFGMDKDPDEEFKIDPMTPTLEFLGSVKEGQQVWMQIMIRAHKKEIRIFDSKTNRSKKVDWLHFAEEEKKKILEKLKDKDNPDSGFRRPTKGEELVVAAIERNTSKLAFDVGIRTVYFAEKDKFNKLMITGMNGVVRQYNSINMNGFKTTEVTSFDYPWQDFNNYRLERKKVKQIKRYKKREFFNIGRRPFVMSSEELATMYHFPGGVVATPTFARIMSKKAQAPSNLPL